MDHSSKNQNTAVKQVLGAVAMLNDKNGTTKQDVFYVLDRLHGKRVKRPAVNRALRIALKKGLLNCLGNRYKIRRQKKHVPRRLYSRVHKVVSKRLKNSINKKSRMPTGYDRLRRHRGTKKLSDVHVSNFECSTTGKVKSTVNQKNYKLQSLLQQAYSNNGTDPAISSADTHSSEAHSGTEPATTRTKRSTKEKQTEINITSTTDIKKSLSSESSKQSSTEPSQKEESGRPTQNKKRGRAANELRQEIERAGTSGRENIAHKTLPVDLATQTKRSIYNLRPRASLKPQDQQSYPRKKARKIVKQEKVNKSPKPEKESVNKSEKRSVCSDNDCGKNQ